MKESTEAFQDMRGAPYSANFWQCADCSEAMKGIRNGVSISSPPDTAVERWLLCS